jgi:hypothetical protein
MGLPERLLIWFALVLTVFGAGWAYRGYFDEHKKVMQLRIDRHATSLNIEHAVQTSEKVDSDVRADGARIEDIRAQVSTRLNKPTYKENHHAPVNDQRPGAEAANPVQADHRDLDYPVLDAGTVRLLNAARTGAELRAAGGRDDQEPPAAGPAG